MNPVLVLSFADGFSGALTIAEPILTAAGLHGCDFFPQGSAGLACHLTEPQLLTLDAAGWDDCSHGTRASSDLTQMEPADALAVLVTSHDYLVNLGITRGARTFGPPAQRWEAWLLPLAVQAGYEVVTVPLDRGGLLPAAYDLEFKPCGADVPLGNIQSWIAGLDPNTIGMLSFHNVRPIIIKENDADAQRVSDVVALALASGLQIVTFSDLLP